MRCRIKRFSYIVLGTLTVFIALIIWTRDIFTDNHQEEFQTGANNPNIKVPRRTVLRKNLLPAYNTGAHIPSMDAIQGPGAKGAKVDVWYLQDNPVYKRLRNQSLHHGVNVYLGNIIGATRILEDKRPTVCKNMVYPKDLPQVSIVVVCRDEAISTLARTMFGALYSSPDYLLKEIILVDDGSVNEELIVAIRIYEESIDKLKVIRNPEPTGLMRARQKGIEATTSDFFVVIDSHIEFNAGWLEPILSRLVEKPKHCLTSNVGAINSETFEYSVSTSISGFICFEQVTVNEQWVRYRDDYLAIRNGSMAPIASCMFPGMMMAMKKDFFLKIGGLDTGMEIWGSEHMEISVRVWRCGGQVEFVPCSIIAHLYRTQPWQAVHKSSRHIIKNKLRTIEIAMEGIARSIALDYIKRMPDIINPGDLANRRQLLLNNQCKSYNFFKQVIKTMTDEIYFPEHPQYYGPVYNKKNNKCMDCAHIDGKFLLIEYQCGGQDNQYFLLTEDGQMKVRTLWVSLNSTENDIELKNDPHDWYSNPVYKWEYTSAGELKHSTVGKCLTIGSDGHIYLDICYKSPNQTWEWPKKT